MGMPVVGIETLVNNTERDPYSRVCKKCFVGLADFANSNRNEKDCCCSTSLAKHVATTIINCATRGRAKRDASVGGQEQLVACIDVQPIIGNVTDPVK